jgi:hypothetical protein
MSRYVALHTLALTRQQTAKRVPNGKMLSGTLRVKLFGAEDLISRYRWGLWLCRQ